MLILNQFKANLKQFDLNSFKLKGMNIQMLSFNKSHICSKFMKMLLVLNSWICQESKAAGCKYLLMTAQRSMI